MFDPGLPSPPRNVRAVEVDKDFVVLEWDEPESDGGVEVVEFLIEKSLSGELRVLQSCITRERIVSVSMT